MNSSARTVLIVSAMPAKTGDCSLIESLRVRLDLRSAEIYGAPANTGNLAETAAVVIRDAAGIELAAGVLYDLNRTNISSGRSPVKVSVMLPHTGAIEAGPSHGQSFGEFSKVLHSSVAQLRHYKDDELAAAAEMYTSYWKRLA